MTFYNLFIIGIFFRLIIFTILIFFPFFHAEHGYFGSFLVQNADFDDYLFVKKILTLDNSPFELSCPSGNKCNLLPISTFFENYKYIINLIINNNLDNLNLTMIVGPVFPALILIFNYSSNFPYLLSIFCFVIEIITLFLWLRYFYSKTNIFYSTLLVFFPFTILFGLIHSPDIITFFLLTLIILNELSSIKLNKYYYVLSIILLTFIKPIGLLLLFFIIFLRLFNKKNIVGYITLFILGSLYYLPYFVVEINKSDITLFPELLLINNVLNLDEQNLLFNIMFYLLKLIVLFGFDISQSGNNYIYFIKFPAAFILLLGFIFNYKNKNNFLKYFVYFYVFSIVIFFYPTYRYIIPIIPILLLNLFIFSNKFKNYSFIKF